VLFNSYPALLKINLQFSQLQSIEWQRSAEFSVESTRP
jgi:hypothetical protein